MRLECGKMACEKCIKYWILENVHYDSISELRYVTKCLYAKCKHKITLEEARSLLADDFFDELCDKFLLYHIAHAKDVRKCPSPNCTYAGVIKVAPCKDKLVCNECHHEWNDPVHLNRWCVDLTKVRSSMWEFIFGEPCIHCGIIIQKKSGCAYVDCASCS